MKDVSKELRDKAGKWAKSGVEKAKKAPTAAKYLTTAAIAKSLNISDDEVIVGLQMTSHSITSRLKKLNLKPHRIRKMMGKVSKLIGRGKL